MIFVADYRRSAHADGGNVPVLLHGVQLSLSLDIETISGLERLSLTD